MVRTMGAIRERYDARREEILASIRAGRVSASMSGIEYCDKPWDDLDMNNPADAAAVSSALTWDGKQHDYDGLRPRSPEELALHAEWMELMFLPHEKRKDRLRAIKDELDQLRKIP